MTLGEQSVDEVLAAWDPKSIAHHAARCADPTSFVAESIRHSTVELAMAGATLKQVTEHAGAIGRAVAYAMISVAGVRPRAGARRPG